MRQTFRENKKKGCCKEKHYETIVGRRKNRVKELLGIQTRGSGVCYFRELGSRVMEDGIVLVPR